MTGVETIDDDQQYRIDNIPNRKAQVLYHQPMRLFSADPFHDEHKSREKETFLQQELPESQAHKLRSRE